MTSRPPQPTRRLRELRGASPQAAPWVNDPVFPEAVLAAGLPAETLEEQVARLIEESRRLSAELEAALSRNEALEAEHLRLAHYRAESDRIRAAEAAATLAQAETEAEQIRSTAAAEARQMIESVTLELNQLEEVITAERAAAGRPGERGAGGAKPAKPPSTENAAGGAASADEDLRGQIDDLLRLREAVTTTLRSALAGLQQQLDALERAPLGDNAESGPRLQGLPAVGPAVEVHVSPVTSILQASELEQSLGEAVPAGSVVLRSVAEGAAVLDVYGVSAEALVDATATALPGATLQPADGRISVVLPKAAA